MPYYPGQSVEADIFIEIQGTELLEEAAKGALTMRVADNSRWANGITVKIGDGDPQYSASQIVTLGTIVTATGDCPLTPALKRTFPAGTPVYRLNDAAVTATRVRPDKTTDAPSVSNVTTGRKRVTFTADQAGRHVLEPVASGAVVAAGAVEVVVTRDEV